MNSRSGNKLRNKSEEVFLKSLKDIEEKYVAIDQVLNTEEEKFKDWDSCLEKSIKNVEYEREVYLALVDVLYTTKGKAVYSDILNTSAEFSFLTSLVERTSKRDLKGGLNKAFHVNFSDITYNDNMLGNRLFVALSIPELKEFLMGKKLPPIEKGTFDENFPGNIPIQEGCMLLVTLKSEKKSSSKDNPVIAYWSEQKFDKIIIEFALVVAGISASDSIIFQDMSEDERIVEVISDGYNLPTESIAMIKNLEREIFEKFADNERRVWGELEPSALSKYKIQQDELTKLYSTMESLKSKIEEERNTQEKYLREMREALIAPSGTKMY